MFSWNHTVIGSVAYLIFYNLAEQSISSYLVSIWQNSPKLNNLIIEFIYLYVSYPHKWFSSSGGVMSSSKKPQYKWWLKRDVDEQKHIPKS